MRRGRIEHEADNVGDSLVGHRVEVSQLVREKTQEGIPGGWTQQAGAAAHDLQLLISQSERAQVHSSALVGRTGAPPTEAQSHTQRAGILR